MRLRLQASLQDWHIWKETRKNSSSSQLRQFEPPHVMCRIVLIFLFILKIITYLFINFDSETSLQGIQMEKQRFALLQHIYRSVN